MKKILAVIAAIATFGFVGAANAADMPVKAPIVKAPAAVPYNWTGLYIGGVVGYGWANAQHCDGLTCVPNPPQTNMRGWNAGVTVGYNWQWANLVLGVEGDWSWANMQGSSPDVPGFGCGTCANTIRSFETARARAGYSFDRFLPYVTAGGGWTQLDASSNGVSGSTTKSSFVVGGGVEYALWQNFSAKLEYLYFSRLGNFTYAPTICATPGCRVEAASVSEVRLGLNYRFSGLLR